MIIVDDYSTDNGVKIV
ncbi:hypothetical protein [Tepiditoga spiralis]